MKQSLVTIALLIIIAIVAFFFGRQSGLEKPVQTEFPGAEKHEVSLPDAVKYVQDFRKANPDAKIKGGAFQRAILDKILAQPGCDGIRFYYGQMMDSSTTIVLVGITKEGTDLTKGSIAERVVPCPPWCDSMSELK